MHSLKDLSMTRSAIPQVLLPVKIYFGSQPVHTSCAVQLACHIDAACRYPAVSDACIALLGDCRLVWTIYGQASWSGQWHCSAPTSSSSFRLWWGTGQIWIQVLYERKHWIASCTAAVWHHSPSYILLGVAWPSNCGVVVVRIQGYCEVLCRLFQLTWLSGKTYFYDVNDFANSTMQYDPLTDGWGATTDGRYLIVSDGSSNISFLDPSTLQKIKSIAVNDNGKAVPMLNEVSSCFLSDLCCWRKGSLLHRVDLVIWYSWNSSTMRFGRTYGWQSA